MVISFAVATTNVGLSFSCIQVKKFPNKRVVTSAPPPDPPMPANAFSNSSIHNTHGEIASANAIALRRFPSDSPTYFPIKRPISKRNNGTSNKFAAALALRDFPHPGTPAIKTPLGISTPYFLALFIFLYTFAFLMNHAFKFSSPPMSSMVSFSGIISRIPAFFIICCFWSNINLRSFLVKSPSSA